MNIKHTLLAASFLLSFAACDQVDDNDRLVGPVDLPKDLERNVLVEDFTGQLCLNCPNAAEQIATMQQVFGKEHVIAVAIHGGQLSMQAAPPYGEGNEYGLATTQGMEYHTRWNATTWPIGMVDRTGGLAEYSTWTASVLQRLIQTPVVSLDMSANTYDATTREVGIHVNLAAKSAAVSGKLQVWLVESGIVGLQIMPSGQYNAAYEHNHVFRASVNDPYGDAVSLAADGDLTKDYTFTLDASWKPENMAVVAFVYNDADGVLQVIEQPIIENENH